MTRDDVVAEARRWLRTPFRHQQRTRGVATDCGGMVGGVAVALGLVPSDWWRREFDPRFSGYAREARNGSLARVCDEFLRPIDRAAMQPGDVVLMQFVGEPQHLAILGDYVHGGLSVIHAMLRVGGVAEHRLSERWAGFIETAYAMPGIE